MPRLTLAPVLLTLAAALTGVAATTQPSPAPIGVAFSIDGVAAGTASVWSGGDRFLQVAWPVAGNPTASAQPAIAPLEFELSPDQVGPWLPLLQEFVASSSTGHRLVVVEQFLDGAPGPAVAYTNAKVQELTVPESGLGGALRFKVSVGDRAATNEMVPARVRNVGTDSRAFAGTESRALSFWTVAVSGIWARPGRADILPIVLRAGSGGIQLVEPLALRIFPPHQQPFQNWLDQALGGTASATTVTVNLPKSFNSTDAWLTLTFANTLPLRVVLEPPGRMYRVELASTQISISGSAAAPAGTSATSPDTGTAPSPTSTSEPTTSAPLDGGAPAPEPAPATAIKEIPATPAEPAPGEAAIRTPADPALSAIKQPRTATTVPAPTTIPSTGTNRSDEGLRDPAEFPRPTGLTRVSYYNSESAHRTVEGADYEGKMAPGELWKAYRKTLASAGWTLEGMNESGSTPETVMILSTWRSGQTSAGLRLYAVKDGGVKVTLTVTTDQ